MIKLRDGSEVEDPRLGRLIQFDERSRSFPIRDVIEAKTPRSYTWAVGLWLKQEEGSCVGHALAHDRAARPAVVNDVTRATAMQIYLDAQKIDPWPGGSYEGASPQYEGTSVLAGAKVCQSLGHFAEYRWGFSLSDLVLAIGYAGPAVLGLAWYRGMSYPDSEGRIRPTGAIDGGHAILAYKVAVKTGKRTIPQVWLHNSWGADWGLNGTCWLSWDDLERLLHEQGEACIPVQRKRVLNRVQRAAAEEEG